jgi:iron(III) transport system ATP-binding protein
MEPDGSGVTGRIVAKRDAIGVDICEVLVEGLERPLGIRQRSDRRFVPGRDVSLTLNPEHVLVFDPD